MSEKSVAEDLSFENDDAFFEMANLPKNITGLPVDLWIHENGNARSAGHQERRIKFHSITDDPRVFVDTQFNFSVQELKLIQDFIIAHKEKIEKIMNPNVDYFTTDFAIELKQVNEAIAEIFDINKTFKNISSGFSNISENISKLSEILKSENEVSSEEIEAEK